MKTSEKC